MAEKSLALTLNFVPVASLDPAVSRAVEVECTFDALIEEPSDKVASVVRDVARVRLDASLSGSLALSGVVPGSTLELRFLADTGATRLLRGLSAGDSSRTLDVPLASADVASILASEPRPPGEAPLVERRAAFLPVGGESLTWSNYRLQVAPVRLDGGAWNELGLATLLHSERPATTAVAYPGDAVALGGFDWSEVKLGVDGRFGARFAERGGDGFLWWLAGPASAIGFVSDALEPAVPRTLAIALPPLAPTADDAPAGTPSGAAAPCSGKGVPADASESELTSNPQIFSEDPGAFCKPFSNPNRIVSERSFKVICRAEQPAIGSGPSVHIVDPPVLELDGLRASAVSADTGLVSRLVRSVREAVANTAVADISASTRAVVRERVPAAYLSFLNKLDRGRLVAGGKLGIQWEGDASRYQATTVTLGHILEYRVRWRSNGYSLGNVQSTLTLAPRQVKRIQKIEWQRSERAARRERTQLVDREADAVSRERSYEDDVQAALSEWAHGESSASTTSGAVGAGFALPGFVIGGGGVHSNASSESSQQGGRRASASEEQRLRDTIRRYADSLRRLESTVVQEISQEESVTGTTEVVRNQNYAHSLTVIYYQILRHLRVDTEFAEVRECLFVPFAIRPFTAARAQRWRELLLRGLRDRQYAPAFAYLRDVSNNFQDSDIPAGRRSQQPVRHVFGSVYIRLGVERPKNGADDAFDEGSWRVLRPFLGLPALQVYSRLKKLVEEQRDRVFQDEHAPRIAATWVDTLQLEAGGQTLAADFTLASRYQFNGVVRVDFSAPIGANQLVTRETLASLKVSTLSDLPPGSVANLTRLSFSYQTDDFQRTVAIDQGQGDLVTVETGAHDVQGAVLTAPPDSWERKDLRAEIVRAVSALIDHLNENVEYYHKTIWWNMDRDRLYMLLDGAYVPRQSGVSVASVVERDPIAILGNCLVFRVSSGSFLGLDDVKTPKELFDYYATRQAVQEPMHVSLPNDGVYAQTIMDECEALEEHFGNTDWALAETEPELGTIDPSLLATRRADPTPGTAPTPFPQTIINLQNAPDAPAPSGLQGVLGAVQNGNAFRDMAGLAGTQENVRAGIAAATTLAQTFGNQAAALRLADMAAKADAAKNTDQKLASIQRAKDKELIDPATAQEHADSVLKELHSPSNPARPHQDAPLMDAVRAAAGQPGSSIEASTPDGTVKVSLAGDESTSGAKTEVDAISGVGAIVPPSESVTDRDVWSILITGYDYIYGGGAKTYAQYARNRAELLLKANPGMRFLLMNVGEGKVYVDQASKGQLRKAASWRAIGRLDFTGTGHALDFHFRAIDESRDYPGGGVFHYPIVSAGGVDLKAGTEPNPIMSITHFYDAVRTFGRAAPATLLEASVLSHGYPLGPILVDSNVSTAFLPTTDPANLNEDPRPRDPADLDGRADRDFFPPTLDSTGKQEMKAAFRDGGRFWLWGCAAAPVIKRMILGVTKQTGYKKDGSTDDTVSFDFNLENADNVARYNEFLGNPSFLPSSGVTVNRTMGEFRAFLQLLQDAMYPQRMATGTGISCFATALGTGAEADSSAALPVHHVDAIYESVVNFNEKYMGLARDGEGRRYVQYTP